MKLIGGLSRKLFKALKTHCEKGFTHLNLNQKKKTTMHIKVYCFKI